jgi:hypothetical protein
MTRQPSLYDPMCAAVRSRQGCLFDTDGPALSGLSCVECGEPMERTPSGYLCCPKGHGRLLEAIDPPAAEPSGLWITDTVEGDGP